MTKQQKISRAMHGGWALLAAVFVAALLGGGLVAYWLFQNIDLRIMLADQPAQITIDQALELRAEARENLQIRLDDTISTIVPVNQTIRIPVEETLKVQARMSGMVPIRMTVAVNDSITIDEVLEVDAVVEAQILGDTLMVPIRGKVPVKATVPINLLIPVNQAVQLDLEAPVDVRIRQDLTVPLVTNIAADIPITADLSVPVREPFDASAVVTSEPIDITIIEALLGIPLKTLRLGLNEPEPPLAAPQ